MFVYARDVSGAENGYSYISIQVHLLPRAGRGGGLFADVLGGLDRGVCGSSNAGVFRGPGSKLRLGIVQRSRFLVERRSASEFRFTLA